MEYPDFKVCVRCFTYNHAKYITETLEGFCIQRTSFPFVCCIVDDSSTDGNQDAILSYVKLNFEMGVETHSYHTETEYADIYFARHSQNPNCYFAILFLKYNHYNPSLKPLKFNYISEWREKCIYEAMCEGDDYWIDPYKLQTQVDLMDSNPLCGMSYTKCRRYIQGKQCFENGSWGGKSQTFAEFLEENTVPTLTVLYRIDAYETYRAMVKVKVNEWKLGDYPMWLYFSHEHQVQYIDRTTSVYRILSESASHFSNPSQYKTFIYSSIDIVDFFVKAFNYPINLARYKSTKLSRMASGLAFLYDDLPAAKEIIKSLPFKSLKDYFKLLIFSNKKIFSIYKRTLDI